MTTIPKEEEVIQPPAPLVIPKRKCKKTWLHTYMEYTSGQESPAAFHKWTALTVLSASLGRHIHIDRGVYTLFPNIFTLLVAGSGKCRKSVSTGMGINILKKLAKPPMIFSQKITNEALIQALVECRVDDSSSGLIYASELSTFMGADAHRSGLIPTLTDLYDSPADWSYRTRGRGAEQMKNVTLCFLAASTTEWLKASIPADSVGGGFTSRVIFVQQDHPSKSVLFPELSHETIALKADLIHDLNIIREVKGEMEFTEEARAFTLEWYAKHMLTKHDAKLDGYFGRKHDTIFKIAILLSISESSDLLIQAHHIKEALRLLEENEVNLAKIMESVTASILGSVTEKILDLVRKDKNITHTKLLRKCWRFANADDLNIHLRTLLECRELKEGMEKDGRTRYYFIP